ncbi:MAG: hypothetical protein LBU32_33105 [Clostridiales bacterium]|nr:hypothetical protein [Clostridiales bacterium]
MYKLSPHSSGQPGILNGRKANFSSLSGSQRLRMLRGAIPGFPQPARDDSPIGEAVSPLNAKRISLSGTGRSFCHSI